MVNFIKHIERDYKNSMADKYTYKLYEGEQENRLYFEYISIYIRQITVEFSEKRCEYYYDILDHFLVH